ncbi:MAG: hypothetical protein H0V68_04700 [Actinobacteria bacterium]|nr:hypothetical protein [Actinomycetota bacterium]
MSRLAFLSPDQAAPEVALVSPLARVLAGADPRVVRDLSLLGKVEVHGDLDLVGLEPGEELVRLAPRRGLVLREGSTASARERFGAAGFLVFDRTAAYAAVELRGETLLRRLTDLDLDALPAVGGLARGVQAIVLRLDADTFRVLVPQELGHYVCEVVLDVSEGLSS